MHSKLLMALFALLMTASLASAATLESASPMGNGGPGATITRELVPLFCQMPDPAGTGLSSQIDFVYPFDSGVVDDYVADASGLAVNAMDWWGQYWNYSTFANSDYYVVSFYLDNGTCYPGGLLSTQDVTTFTETYDATNAWYAVSASIADVAQTPGQRYWVEVQSVLEFTPNGQWGWQTCIAEGGDCGAPLQGFPLLGIPYWTAQAYIGMAFCLYNDTIAVEENTVSSVKSLY